MRFHCDRCPRTFRTVEKWERHLAEKIAAKGADGAVHRGTTPPVKRRVAILADARNSTPMYRIVQRGSSPGKKIASP